MIYKTRSGIIFLVFLILLFEPSFLSSVELPRTRQDYLTLLSKQPDHFDLVLDFSVWLVRRQDNEAFKYLQKAEKLNPYSPELFYWKGEYYLNDGYLQKALFNFREATKLYPRFKAAHKKIKAVQLKITESKDLVDEKIKLFKKQPSLLNLIVLQRQVAEYGSKRRIQVFNSLKKFHQTFNIIHFWLAADYRSLENNSLELKHLKAYLKRESGQKTARLRLAQLFEKTGQNDQALKQYEYLMRHSRSKDPELFLAKGRILKGKQQYQDAVAHYYSAMGQSKLFSQVKEDIISLSKLLPLDSRLQEMTLVLLIRDEEWNQVEKQLEGEKSVDLYKIFKRETQDLSYLDHTRVNRIHARILTKMDKKKVALAFFKKVLNRIHDDKESLAWIADHIDLVQSKQQAIHYLIKYVQYKPSSLKIWRKVNDLSVALLDKKLNLHSLNKLADLATEKDWKRDQKRIYLSVELNKTFDAIRILKPWLTSESHKKEASVMISQLYRNTGAFSEALAEYEKAVVKEFSEKTYLQNYVQRLVDQKHYKKAVEIIETMHKINSNDRHIKDQLVNLYQLGGFEKKAYSFLDRELKEFGLSEELEGYWLKIKGQTEKDKRNRLDGRISMLKGDHDRAERYFSDVSQASSEVVEWRIRNLSLKHDWNFLDRILNHQQQHFSWHYWKSEVLIHQRLYDTADVFLRKGLILNPGKLRLLIQRARIYSRQGREKAADEMFEKLAEANYSTEEVIRFHAVHSERFKKWDSAEKDWIKLTEQFPKKASYWNSLGAIKSRQKNWVQALSFFNRALNLEPQFSSALYNKGLAMVALKDKEELLLIIKKLKVLNSRNALFLRTWWNRRWRQSKI